MKAEDTVIGVTQISKILNKASREYRRYLLKHPTGTERSLPDYITKELYEKLARRMLQMHFVAQCQA